MNALHGMGNLTTTRWKIESCSDSDPHQCDVQGLWQINDPGLQTGIGAVKERVLDWREFLTDPGTAQRVTLRITVWNPGSEDQALHGFAFYDYQPQNPGT